MCTLKKLVCKGLLAFFSCFISTQICTATFLVWDSDSEGHPAGYNVYYGTSSRNYIPPVDVGNVTAYNLDDLDLTEGVIYHMAITAYGTTPGDESEFSAEVQVRYVADDGFPAAADNCPYTYNPDQEDTYPPQGNGIGDACDCEGDFDCDGGVDTDDVEKFLFDFGRSSVNNDSCINDWCYGDFDCDGDQDGSDASLFKSDFGRSAMYNPCPGCTVADCSY